MTWWECALVVFGGLVTLGQILAVVAEYMEDQDTG